MATAVANLTAARDNLCALLATEIAYQVTNGPKPTYSLDGESVSWDEWRAGVQEGIDKLTRLIQVVGGPYTVSSRGVT